MDFTVVNLELFFCFDPSGNFLFHFVLLWQRMSQSYSAYFGPKFSTGLGYLSWSLSYKSCRLDFLSKGYLWNPMPASDGASSFNLILQNKLKKDKRVLTSGKQIQSCYFFEFILGRVIASNSCAFRCCPCSGRKHEKPWNSKNFFRDHCSLLMEESRILYANLVGG